MMSWEFIKPNKDLSLKEKISYTEGYFSAVSQIHNNLSIHSDDKEFNKLNIETKKYMYLLKNS